ncbi:MAG: xylulokinase [Verrucomicrobiota bacterium]|jgi:xylulokinase
MWLAFDLGTSGVRAAVLDNDGKIVRSAVEPYPTHIANGGVVEQEVSDWWRALVTAARVVDGEVTKIVLTGQMQDLILLNERGEPLRPAILYSDMRAQAEAAAIIERVGKERLIALTGNEQSADSLWAKALWLKRNQLDLLSTAKILLFSPADYAAYKITGNAVTDTTTASTTGLMMLRGRRWLDRATLEEFGSGEIGPRLWLSRHERLDRLQRCAAWLVGAGRFHTGAYPPDQYIHVAPLLTAGGNLEWVRDLFGEVECGGLID